jgi:tryptophanase
MKNLKEIYAPVYGCAIFDDRHEDDDIKVIDYEMMSSICKSIKANQMKLLHKRIIDIADELYRFSDELDMSDKEERNCKISIIEALKELDHVAEYLTKHTLGDTSESYESSK